MRGHQVFDSKTYGLGCNELRDDWQPSISHLVCRYTLREDPIVDRYGCGARRCYCSDLYRPCQFCELVFQNVCVLITRFSISDDGSRTSFARRSRVLEDGNRRSCF